MALKIQCVGPGIFTYKHGMQNMMLPRSSFSFQKQVFINIYSIGKIIQHKYKLAKRRLDPEAPGTNVLSNTLNKAAPV